MRAIESKLYCNFTEILMLFQRNGYAGAKKNKKKSCEFLLASLRAVCFAFAIFRGREISNFFASRSKFYADTQRTRRVEFTRRFLSPAELHVHVLCLLMYQLFIICLLIFISFWPSISLSLASEYRLSGQVQCLIQQKFHLRKTTPIFLP